MTLGVAAATPIAGDTTGTFKDDLTNPSVGEWSKLDNIRRIVRIVVYAGSIIDSVRITYDLGNGPNITVQHGGSGGTPVLDYTLLPGQKLVAVYGRRLVNPTPYGKHNLVQLSFIFGTSGAGGKDGATCLVKVASATNVTLPNIEFDFSWSLAGATSYSFQPASKPNVYLQGLGFTEVLSLAGGTV